MNVLPTVGDEVLDVGEGAIGTVVETQTHPTYLWVKVLFENGAVLEFYGFDLEAHPAEDGAWLVDSTALDG